MFIATAVHEVASEEDQVCRSAAQGEHGFAKLGGDGAAAANMKIADVEDAEAVERGRDFGMRKLDDLDWRGIMRAAE